MLDLSRYLMVLIISIEHFCKEKLSFFNYCRFKNNSYVIG